MDTAPERHEHGHGHYPRPPGTTYDQNAELGRHRSRAAHAAPRRLPRRARAMVIGAVVGVVVAAAALIWFVADQIARL